VELCLGSSNTCIHAAVGGLDEVPVKPGSPVCNWYFVWYAHRPIMHGKM
jgi:hypothetical protein